MDYLNALGALKSEIQSADELQTPLELFMRDVGMMFVELMRQKIDEDGVNSNGAMRQGLDVVPVQDATGVSAPFTAESEYTLWRNDGVSGTQVQRDTPFSFKAEHPSKAMAKNIEQWLVNYNSRAANAVNYFNSQGITKYEPMSWAIAYGVLRSGIEGAKFIERSFSDENLNSFENALLLLTEQYTTGQFERILPNLR